MEGKILAVGDSAVSVQLGSEISLDVNQKVRKLFINLTEKPRDGVVEMVPTYAALRIHYRPDKILFRQMKEEIEERFRKLEDSQQTVQEGGRIVKEIPICYDRDLALDLEACAEFEHISVEEFIRIQMCIRDRIYRDRLERISSSRRNAASSLLINSSSLTESGVMMVIIFVVVSKPAPGTFRLLASIMSRCFFSSFFREFSSMFSVSIEKPHKNCPGFLCSPRCV